MSAIRAVVETTSARRGRALRILRAAPELEALGLFTGLWLFGVLVLRLPIATPSAGGWMFVSKHYFGPIALAGLSQLALAAAMIALRRRHSSPHDVAPMLKLAPVMVGIVFLHFNFKAWMPLVNHHSYDSLYMVSDRALQPVIDSFRSARNVVGNVSPISVDGAYHALFVMAFFVSSLAHALFDTIKGMRRLVLAAGLVLLFGGVAYWAAPAVGPFVYEAGLNARARGTQAAMWQMYQTLVRTGQFPPGYFAVPPAAMPSLHIANMLVFVIFARRRIRWLFWAYLPLLGWIIIESVASRFHYLIDLPAGALLALGCIWCADWLIPEVIPVRGCDRSRVMLLESSDRCPSCKRTDQSARFWRRS